MRVGVVRRMTSPSAQSAGQSYLCLCAFAPIPPMDDKSPNVGWRNVVAGSKLQVTGSEGLTDLMLCAQAALLT